MIFFVILLVLTFLAQIVEFFIPPLDWMYNARIYIVPVIVFYGAMALPLPLVLALAGFAGFLLDALTVNTPLRRSGVHYAWPEAFVHPGTLGSALRNERAVHVRDSPLPISYDFFPARLTCLHP